MTFGKPLDGLVTPIFGVECRYAIPLKGNHGFSFFFFFWEVKSKSKIQFVVNFFFKRVFLITFNISYEVINLNYFSNLGKESVYYNYCQIPNKTYRQLQMSKHATYHATMGSLKKPKLNKKTTSVWRRANCFQKEFLIKTPKNPNWNPPNFRDLQAT